MKQLIKLTKLSNSDTILIGTQNIMSVDSVYIKEENIYVTKIQCKGPMIETFFVTESVDEIYNLYNSL